MSIVKADFRRRDNKRLSDLVRIGFFNSELNKLQIVATYENWNNEKGVNDGFLCLYTSLYYCRYYAAHQKGNNFAGGYNKPIANLEETLTAWKEENNLNYEVDYCGSIYSLMTDLMNELQKQYEDKLFLEVLI